MKPCAGDWVEVRSKEEILSTLDKSGRLEGLPFMPQMFKYCGQRFQVYKRAHKTCDTVSGRYVARRLPDGVHLNLRCDGQAYDGCQAGCLIFWKEAWLKPVAAGEASRSGPATPNQWALGRSRRWFWLHGGRRLAGNQARAAGWRNEILLSGYRTAEFHGAP